MCHWHYSKHRTLSTQQWTHEHSVCQQWIMTRKWCRELSYSFKFTAWEPCLNNCTSNTYDLLSGTKCGSPWQQLSMVHRPRSSHGDKVLNRPTVLAMWGVTLIDVPQWISLHRLCGKLSAVLSLHAGTLSLPRGGRSYLKDIKQICRFGGHKRAAAGLIVSVTVSCSPLHPDQESVWGLFFFFFFLERTTDSFGTDLKCECSTWLSVSSSLWQEILWKKLPPVKTVNLPLGSARAGGERKSSQLSLWVMSVTGSYAIWLHRRSLCRAHTKETPESSACPRQWHFSAVCSRLTHKKSSRVHDWNGGICKNMQRRSTARGARGRVNAFESGNICASLCS